MTKSTPENRLRLREYYEQHDAISRQWAERSYTYPAPRFPSMPNDLRDLTCGAKTKAGHPCKQKALYISGRCKWHGGCSTGPKTEAGKEQARINGRKGGRPKQTEPKT